MNGRAHDIQGRFLGIPYDWRRPTLGRLASRLYNPGGGMLSPKWFGWGFTLNLAHRGSRWLLLSVALLALLLGTGQALLGG